MRKILTIATAIYFLFVLVIGVNIFSNTQDKENQENDKYISAPVVTTGEEYLQQIGKGTKYIYMQGTLQALDPVTDAEIEPACLKIVKTKEKKSYRHGHTSHCRKISAVRRKYLLETLKSLDMDVLAMEIMPDHIHLLVDCKPQRRLSDAVKILKGNTARWLSPFMQ